VLSSNFASKEFELSRPQMIVGRTDENDLVINHRSISRNHAKVVREPDTGRYTISDLQSSNGVRVNGQDYGKVELRRGDVVDLGHVRLRFVEPGEDFVFARDAVITAVPDSSSKKGLLVAIVLGILVLGGVLVFFLMRDPEKGNGNGTGPGTGSSGNFVHTPDGDTQVAIADAPGPPVDVAPVVDPNAENQKIALECKTAITDKDWPKLSDCGKRLTAKGGAEGQSFVDLSTSESKAEAALRNMKAALKKDFKEATRQVNSIATTSVYYKDAKDAYDGVRNDLVQSTVADLNQLAKDCTKYNQKAKGVETLYGKGIVDDAKKTAKRCEKETVEVVPKKPCDGACKADEECKANKCVTKKVDVPNPCADVQFVTDTEAKAEAAMNAGSYAMSLSLYERILRCKPILQAKTYMAACKARDLAKAKAYYKGLKTTSLNLPEPGIDPR
jgi:pSer/pThr/pTyr-binding forkhead associated (FHA) protein